MNVGLYDVDSKIPNLALMKIARWHKEKGDAVERYSPLLKHTYDKVYASKVFDFSESSYLDEETMEIGGTGYDLNKNLAQHLEDMVPDYTLYNYPHSIGFSMRGCRFKCSFCVVPRKEGRPKPFNTISEIWTNRGSDFIVLLDNDFFGNVHWQDRIKEIKDFNLKVNFNQGLNIRIITDEQAKALASVEYRSLSNNTKMVHFAWDRPMDELAIMRGVERVTKAGIPPANMTFYVLVGYDTTREQDMHRVMTLRDLGANPYVMPYDRKDPYQRHFARWVNHKAIFKSVKWEHYINGERQWTKE